MLQGVGLRSNRANSGDLERATLAKRQRRVQTTSSNCQRPSVALGVVLLRFGNASEAGRQRSLRGASRGPAVCSGMTQFRHGARLDLADPLTRESEEDPDLFEGARLAPVETEAQS